LASRLKLFLVAVGHKMPTWVRAGFEEYAARMPPEACIELIEIKPEKRAPGNLAQALKREAARIDAALQPGWERVVLDERGTPLSTLELSQKMKGWMAAGRDLAFIIGGADGLADSLKAGVGLRLSLSPLTLPHGLARVVLAEQLYRVVSIIYAHPYHRR
jgi:23S rRNA (pseudouridine1915-N3)-methyltransferase